jgi:hypothetical protein
MRPCLAHTRALALSLAIVGLSLPARATTCVKPDFLAAFPPDGATSVPPNAKLTAHYDPIAQYIDEDVRLVRGQSAPDGGTPASSGPGESVPVTFSEDEGRLTTTPPDGLVPGEHYVIEWPKLRGIGTASRGRGANVGFTVGTRDDVEAPSFEGLTGIEWDVVRQSDDCTSSIEERFVFDVTPGKAGDDSGMDTLALVVYQTRGGDVGNAASRPVLTAPFPTSGGSVRVERPIDGAKGHVCFAAHVMDLTGRVSTGNGANKEVCVTTTPPPFFYGCRLSSPGRASEGERKPSDGAAVGLGISAAVLSFCKRRRHRVTP